jgi:N-methylhydantoinase A/oxoprolinase/acetone carboxylase beta subunit
MQKEVDKVKRLDTKVKKSAEMHKALDHIHQNSEDFGHLFSAHKSLGKAKDVLLKTLENSGQNQEHTINSKHAKPEGFVVGYKDGSVSKVVNRSKEGFSGQNLNK